MTRSRRSTRLAEWRHLRVRRLVAALLVGAAVMAGLTALRPTPEAAAPVLVAARDLPAGHRVTADDVRTATWPKDLLPDHRLRRDQLTGRHVLGPVRSGEPLTASRLLTARNLPAPSGTDLVVGVPLGSSGIARLIRPGDRVDVLDQQGGTAARSAAVVAVVSGDSSSWKGGNGPAAMLAVSRAEAQRISRAQASGVGGTAPLTVALRPRR